MNSNETYARTSLEKLVEHVFASRSILLQPITYEELASRIGRVNQHGVGHAHGMGSVLGRMGHLLKQVGDRWGEPIPEIQSLVVQKSGPRKGLPDDGISEFWPDYPAMSRAEKESKTRVEHDRVARFGSRWNEVLTQLQLTTVGESSPAILSERVFGRGGESPAHRDLKEFVRLNPAVVGASADSASFIEYPLPTLDVIDVFFRTPKLCIGVEVKSKTSESCPSDFERGLFQTVKYRALLQAMAASGRHSVPSAVTAVLVLETELPERYVDLAKKLEVTVIERVREKVESSQVLPHV